MNKRKKQNYVNAEKEAPKKHGAAINKHLALVLYILLAIVSAALLLMTILASAGISDVWNGMPIIVVLSLFGVALAVSVVAFNPKKTFYSIGFYVLHIGIVLFFIGSLVYAVSGEVTNAAPPNVKSITTAMEYQMKQNGESDRSIATLKGYYNQVGKADGSGEIIDLGFNFRIVDFKTELYEDGMPKHYEATVEFLNKDGTTEQEKLTVNHPIYRGDWKIYLMDVGKNSIYGFQEIQLMFKKDPTETLSDAGIILIILGTFMMCFIRPRDKAQSEENIKEEKKKVKGGEGA